MIQIHTTNYYNTFIEVAEDCPVTTAEFPPNKTSEKTVANLQYDMLSKNPYKFTSDEILFTIYATRNNIKHENMEAERIKFFSKGQPCFRSSPLPKRYGWGIHCNESGKIAVFAVESDEYKRHLHDGSLQHKRAMCSKKNK